MRYFLSFYILKEAYMVVEENIYSAPYFIAVHATLFFVPFFTFIFVRGVCGVRARIS